MEFGKRSPYLSIVLAVVALCAFAAPRSASAAWPPFGRAITTAINSQQHSVVTSDGAGGAIIAWQDLRNPKVNMFAQHVLASGELDGRWPTSGVSLLADPAGMDSAAAGQNTAVIVPDGAGGAIVAWLDLRSAATETDIFAQHVLASGVVDPTWTTNGTAICVIEGIQNTQTIISDGAGGAIITWRDGRPGANATDIYAQHLLASGDVDPRWPVNGRAVCSAPAAQEAPVITDDGAGGAIISWHDLRADPNNFDIYAQHLPNSGVVDRDWPDNGLAVCLAAGSQGFPTIASDGAHGAVIAWTDGRSVDQDHIFAQHVLGSGSVDPAWPVNGRAVSSVGDIETRPIVVSDGAGGAVVSWQRFTTSLNQLAQFAQHVTAAGVLDPAWPPAGRALSISEEQQTNGDMAADGAGGAVVTWVENHDVFAQHVLASGALDPTYPAIGRDLAALPSGQGDPAIAATGGGGAIVAWTDTRSGVGVDIYAMQVLEATTTGVPAPSAPNFTFRRPGPNPARGTTSLRFTLPDDASVRLAVYDVSGRRVRELMNGAQPAGEHAIGWDLRDERGTAVAAGVYFVRLETGGRTFTQKLATLR